MKKKLLWILLPAVVATLISSSVYQRQAGPIRYAGVEPGWSYAYVIAGGWPFPFIYDSMYLSPAKSVDMMGVLLGLDDFYWGPFLADVAVFAALFALVGWLRQRRKTAAALLCLLTLTAQGENVRISPGDVPYGEPAIAVHGDRVIVVASKFTKEGPLVPVAFASADGGATWREKALPVPKLEQATDCWVTFSDSGVAYVTALLIEAGGKTPDLGVFRSRDGGESWERAALLKGPVDLPFSVARGKELVIAAERGDGLILLHSADEAATFTERAHRPTANLSHNAMNPLWIGDTLHVPYVDFGEQLASARVSVISTTDYGKTWSAPRVVADVPRRFPGHARFAAQGGQLHAAISGGTAERRTISVGQVTVSNRDAQAFRPSLAAGAAGKLAVTWLEPEGGCTRLWWSSSADGGKTFSKPLPLAEELSCADTPANQAAYRRWAHGGDYFDLDAAGDSFIAVWADAREGTFQLYCDRVAPPPTTTP
ncbi:MAG TPA: hypothetical protein VGF28_10105 [Thermoanaerobaculia bacterium]|jgi:hypothetical protein